METKSLYNSGFPLFSFIVYLAPLAIMLTLIINGMSIISTVFYGLILVIISIMLNKDNQWIKLHEDYLSIINLNPFKASVKIDYEKIVSLENENGIDTIFIGGNLIAGVPDRIYIKFRTRNKIKTALLRTVGLDSENPLFRILSEKVKIKTPPNN
jgi:hypothetical protein